MNSWMEYSALLNRRSIRNTMPLHGQFELTGRCNLSCKMCYVSCKAGKQSIMQREKTAKEWIDLAYDARDMGMLFLLLTGGEVLLREDFPTIYEQTAEMGFIQTIYSNGTLITPKIASWLGNRPPSEFTITLYGASRETYQRLCKNGDAFDRVMRGIDLLIDQGVSLSIRTTITKENYMDYDAMVHLAQSRDLTLHTVEYVAPPRKEEHRTVDDIRLTPEELVQLEGKREQELHWITNNMDFAIEKTNLMHSIQNEIKDHPFFCNCGKNAFWVTWEGKMIPCYLLEEEAINPFEVGFEVAWRHIVEQCRQVPSCSKCSQCDLQYYCLSCPARLKIETGSYDRPAQYLCNIAKKKQSLYQTYLDNCELGNIEVM